MSNCSKVCAIVSSACLSLALSGSVLTNADTGIGMARSCEQAVRLLESSSSGLGKISVDGRDANAGIVGIADSLERRFTDVDDGLGRLARSCRSLVLSFIVDEQACASGATRCACQLSAGPGGSGSVLSPISAGLLDIERRNPKNSDAIAVGGASALNNNPVAVTIFVSRDGVPVIGLDSGAFEFSLAFAPFGGPTALSGCGSDSFQEAGNGVYQMWLWPSGVTWAPGTYVGRLDATDDDGFTVNILVPIRIQ